jgi:hypothetical protein
MGDVLFVRELAADRDLILAFAADGSPAWALDLESGLQWWYPGGNRARVRAEIAAHWADFPTMPISAASYAGPHPALELGRQADAAVRVAAPTARPSAPWTTNALAALRELSVPARVAVVAGGVLLVVTVVPWLLSFLLAGTPSSTGDARSAAVPPVATAGERCDVRGEVSHDDSGHVLVCVPPSRALSYELLWRSA